jgi:ribosomal protein L18
VRAAAADAEASNERVSVFATTPHKHTQILSKAPDTVIAAIEDVIHQLPDQRSTTGDGVPPAARAGRGRVGP